MVQHEGGLSGDAGVERGVGSEAAFSGCSEKKTVCRYGCTSLEL